MYRWSGKSPRRKTARPGPKQTRLALTIPRLPNEVWTVDFKGWFRTLDVQRVNRLNVRDLFSRFILGIRLLPWAHASVQCCLQMLFIQFGQPKVIRVDHGSPFAGVGALDLSRLSAWWLRLGIQVEFTRWACPQDNGDHEQMHRIYKADLASPPAAPPRAQQHRSTRWVHYYNHQRSHEALGQRTAARLYYKSRRRYREPLPPLRYRHHWQTRRVSSRGYIHWRGRARGIGRAFSGENIGLKPLENGAHEVYFDKHLIGVLVGTDTSGMRPARWTKKPSHSKQP